MPNNNSTPYEILGAPFEVYIGAVGTDFPDIDAVPDSGDWKKLGTSGSLNQTQDGVKVSMGQTTSPFRAAGDTGSRKIFRTEEDVKIILTLADMTVEQLAHALNENAITTTAAATGVAGNKKIGLSRGMSVATMALLVRGPSPYMPNGNAQFEVPIAAQTGNPEPVFRNGEVAGLAIEFTALVDSGASSPDEYHGRFRAETAAAT